MKDSDNVDTDLLTPSLQEVVEVIGLTATMKLIERYGGTRLWVPKKITSDHHLVKTIGMIAANKLCDYYRLESLLIDRAERAMKALRNADIVRRYRGGETAATLAIEYGLHERMIWYIDAEANKDERQISLL